MILGGVVTFFLSLVEKYDPGRRSPLLYRFPWLQRDYENFTTHHTDWKESVLYGVLTLPAPPTGKKERQIGGEGQVEGTDLGSCLRPPVARLGKRE